MPGLAPRVPSRARTQLKLTEERAVGFFLKLHYVCVTSKIFQRNTVLIYSFLEVKNETVSAKGCHTVERRWQEVNQALHRASQRSIQPPWDY